MRVQTTNRLVLEPLQPRHAAALFEGLRDERLYKWIEERPPNSVEALQKRYERLQTRRSADGKETWLNWAVRMREGQEYIGYVQATIQQHDAMIAYVLFADAWSKGLGREAVSAMTNELIDFYGVSTIRAVADERNTRSVNLLRGLGFQESTGAKYAARSELMFIRAANGEQRAHPEY